MLLRQEYLNKLSQWQDEQVIKVITGIRRCGKSTLLLQFQQQLLQQNVAESQILSLNFENLEYEALLDYHKLYRYLLEHLSPVGRTYIFLDEIQKVPDFQKVVDSLYIRKDTDIYITGSNAYLLSGELATLLSGRYVEISMLPLSFREYAQLHPDAAPDALFAEFLQVGGFPYLATMAQAPGKASTYLEGIYSTIVLKDIEERWRQKGQGLERKSITDLSLLKSIARFLAGSVGNLISVKKVADYITSTGRKVSPNTIDDYIEMLTEAYVFYPVDRFDIVGKQLMQRSQKIYIVDLGIRRHLISRREYDLGFSLENVVFLELNRRGYTVNIGKLGNSEVDFVAQKDGVLHYFQVTASMTEQATFQRELAPLKSIQDNYAKTILTLDRFTIGNYDGIAVINAVDWLLGK